MNKWNKCVAHSINQFSKLRMSKVDQENVSLLIEKWQKTNPGDLFFFRPYGTNISADSTWRPFYNEHGDNMSGVWIHFFRSTVVAEYWLKVFKFTFVLFSNLWFVWIIFHNSDTIGFFYPVNAIKYLLASYNVLENNYLSIENSMLIYCFIKLVQP